MLLAKSYYLTPTEPVGSCLHCHEQEDPVDWGTMESPGVKDSGSKGLQPWKRNISSNAHQVPRLTPSECHLFSHIYIQYQIILLPISVVDINKFHSKFKNTLVF